MCSSNSSRPSTAEVDALERVLSEAHGQNPDGYWRALAEEGLEAAKGAAMRDAVAAIDAEIAGTQELIQILRGDSMGRIDPLKLAQEGVFAPARGGA